MTIQFKDKSLEAILEAKAEKIGKSASQVASQNLERYHWLLANEYISLTWQEFHALTQTVKSMPHLLQTSQVRRFALLVEDAMRSTTMSNTGQYSKENLWPGMTVDELCKKLHDASPAQIFSLLDRIEQYSEEQVTQALLSQGR